MGTGDPDVYRAFCWRFWNLIRAHGGRLGVVLPRSAFCAKGSADFREELFSRGSASITFLLNNRNWVFPDVHPQYTIGLSSLERRPDGTGRSLSMLGPFRSYDAFLSGIQNGPVTFSADDVLSWTDTAALPLLPAEESADVFAQLRKAPRLELAERGQWRARPHRELDATNDKNLMTLTEKRPKDYWPVFKGASFDIWNPDTGVYYAWAEPEKMQAHLSQKRRRSARNRRSPFHGFPSQWLADRATLPCLHPRIAFRDVSRATDT